MKKMIFTAAAFALLAGNGYAADRGIDMSVNPNPALVGNTVRLVCTGTGEWQQTLRSAQITITDASDTVLVSGQRMQINGRTATFDYTVPADEMTGEWDFKCNLTDRRNKQAKTSHFTVTATVTGGGSGGAGTGQRHIRLLPHITARQPVSPAMKLKPRICCRVCTCSGPAPPRM